MTPLDLTLSAIEAHGWTALLLQPRSKDPLSWCLPCDNPTRICRHYPGGQRATTNPEEIRGHRGNIGLYSRNVAILDFDDNEALEEMIKHLGAPAPIKVVTGSGKYHYYVKGDPTLPGKIRWQGKVAGDLRRVAKEYVVCPPSIHPNGKLYTWLRDPRAPLPELPPRWRAHLEAQPSSDCGTRPGIVKTEFEIPGEPVQKGDRHLVLFRWLRAWKARGFTFEETLELLTDANQIMFEPPIPPEEFRTYFKRSWEQEDRESFRR